MGMEYTPEKELDAKSNKQIEYYADNINKIENFYINKAEILLEALPYIKQYFNKIVIIKMGGSMMEDDKIMQSVLDDVILMKYVGMKVVLVHGGGKQITKLMEEKNIDVKFVDGLRVTDRDTIDIVKMVLLGNINTRIVASLNKHGNIAMGITGNDGNCIMCSRKKYSKDGKEIDLGFVGEIEKIDPDFIKNLLENDYIPVIATLGTDTAGNIYNINADLCASRVAVALRALKMILLTDVDGIIEKGTEDSDGRLVSRLSSSVCREMVENGNINKGMIPKVTSCMEALTGGVQRTHILNGTTAHSILIEIFTNRGIGTMITL